MAAGARGPDAVQRFGSLRSPTLSRQISAELVRRIVRSEIKPGDALASEDELALQFDVSRPVIREAVKELAVMGLVESRQGRSTRVAPVESWNHFDPGLLLVRSEVGAVDDILLELLELRRIIETGAAGLAATRATDEDLERMDAALARMESSLDDVEHFTDADISFHDALLAATGNHILTRLIDMIAPLLRFGRKMSLQRRPDGPADSQRGHREIMAAVRAGDPEAARLAMREHLSWTADLRIPDEEPAVVSSRGRRTPR